MNAKIIFKNNSTPLAQPTNNDLLVGELAINTNDGVLFLKTNSGVYPVAANSTITNTEITAFPSGLVFENLSTSNITENSDWFVLTDPAQSSNYPYLSTIAQPSIFEYPVVYAIGLSYIRRGNVTKVKEQFFHCATGNNYNEVYYTTDFSSWGRVRVPNGFWQKVLYIKPKDKVIITTNYTAYCQGTDTVTMISGWPYLDVTAGSLKPIVSSYQASTESSKGTCLVSNGQSSYLISNYESLNGPYNSYLGLMPISANWIGVAWNGVVFCAIIYSSNVYATSTDGINWVQRNFATSRLWRSIAWNGSVFCAVVYNSNIVATSPDGITWTEYNLPATRNWISIASNGTEFVVVATSTTYIAKSSDNGQTWTEYNVLPAANAWIKLIWDGSSYILGANFSNSNAYTNLAESTDAITWTVRSSQLRAFGNIFYLPNLGLYIQSTNSSAYLGYNTYTYSYNKINWSSVRSNTCSLNTVYFELEYNNTVTPFAYAGPAAELITLSQTTEFYTGLSPISNATAINNNQLVVTCYGSGFAYSFDGVDWIYSKLPNSATRLNITFNGSFFVLTSTGSTSIYATSPNGIVWTLRNFPAAQNLTVFYCHNNMNIGLSSSLNRFIYSLDGLNWTTVSLPVLTTGWTQVCYFKDTFIAFNSNGLFYIYDKNKNYFKAVSSINLPGLTTTTLDVIEDYCIYLTTSNAVYRIDIDTANLSFAIPTSVRSGCLFYRT